MRNRSFFLLLLGALAIAVVGGCTPKPDLEATRLPDLGTDPVAYCHLDSNGDLLITVKNQGSEAAPATTTAVTFTSLPTGEATVEQPTLALEIGASVTLPAIDLDAFESNCYQADCHFTITLDSGNAADESNEENNTVKGYCIG